MHDFSFTDLHVSHARYDAALEMAMNAIQLAGGQGTCIPILGPTRVGKTELLAEVSRRASTVRSGPGNMIPTSDFLAGEIYPKPNDTEIYASVIRTMGRVGANPKLALLQDRMFDLLSQRNVRIVALDECSHCAEPGANLTRRAAADHFKSIIDRSGIILILVGLPKFQRLIDENEQFSARSMATIELHPYRWTNSEDRTEFITFAYTILDYIADQGIKLEFDWADMTRRLYAASGGRVGVVVRLMTIAVRMAARPSVLMLGDVAKAAGVSIQKKPGGSPIFDVEPPQDVVLLRSYAKVMKDAGLRLIDPNSSLELEAFRDAEKEAAAA